MNAKLKEAAAQHTLENSTNSNDCLIEGAFIAGANWRGAQIIEALLQIGFIQPYEHSPNQLQYQGYPLKIYESTTLSQVFEQLIKMGATLKTWEFKRVMEIQP